MPSNTLPETGYVRLPQIIGDLGAKPPIPPVIPVSRSTWWAWIKAGKAPAGTKLSPRVTVWRVEEILALIQKKM